MRLPDSLSPLRERPYRLLWTARTVSAVGDALIPVTVVFAILRAGGTAANVGEVLTCGSVGQVLMLPVGGVWSDRLPRRLVLMATDAIQAVCYGLLAVMVFTHHAAVWQFALVYTIAGMAWAFFVPAASALVPDLVGTERLQPANAMLGLSNSSASVLGPAAAGALLAISSPGIAILIDAVSFVVSFTMIARVQVTAHPKAVPGRFRADLVGGWRALAARRWYLANLLAYGSANFALACFFVLGPVVMQEGHGGATSWAAIMVCGSVGSIVGGVLALRYRPRRPMAVSDLLSVIGAIPVVLTAFVVPVPYIGIGLAVAFGQISLTNEIWSAAQQQLFPREILARITSLDWTVSLIATPAGYAAAAPMAQALGVRTTLLIAAVLTAGPLMVMAALPGVRSVRRRADGSVVVVAPDLAVEDAAEV
ncbi:MAG TPA: MFS transporter [Actinocrinis sp.]|nr:MFS transporter [Actinocrinis sp.]